MKTASLPSLVKLLGREFHLPEPEIRHRLRGLAPCGVHRGRELFSVEEARLRLRTGRAHLVACSGTHRLNTASLVGPRELRSRPFRPQAFENRPAAAAAEAGTND